MEVENGVVHDVGMSVADVDVIDEIVDAEESSLITNIGAQQQNG